MHKGILPLSVAVDGTEAVLMCVCICVWSISVFIRVRRARAWPKRKRSLVSQSAHVMFAVYGEVFVELRRLHFDYSRLPNQPLLLT